MVVGDGEVGFSEWCVMMVVGVEGFGRGGIKLEVRRGLIGRAVEALLWTSVRSRYSGIACELLWTGSI